VDQYFLIAEIVAVQGSEGDVLIDSYSDFNERFFRLKNAFIEFFGNKKEFIVENVSEFNGIITLKFKGFDTSKDAQILVGKKIFIEDKNSVKLEKDLFFIHDLIGCEVIQDTKRIGKLIDVLILPSNDVYVVEEIDHKKILVPAVKDYIKSIDIKRKRLELVPNCDLLYDDEN
jgi:16S rRNA processing protein RimM